MILGTFLLVGKGCLYFPTANVAGLELLKHGRAALIRINIKTSAGLTLHDPMPRLEAASLCSTPRSVARRRSLERLGA
ncbi:hypothetical protein [Nitrosomonas sp. Nm132]|uniref:hypothetical protein n=1 Tax=Nitrosomonas sp. Nm132 TaxID=1881053 RepID=UPI0015A1EE8E|nr:hypothetical protein [Nitrosomonas sp. Nm132]